MSNTNVRAFKITVRTLAHGATYSCDPVDSSARHTGGPAGCFGSAGSTCEAYSAAHAYVKRVGGRVDSYAEQDMPAG